MIKDDLNQESSSPNVSPQSSPSLQTKSPHHKRESSVSSSRESVPDKSDGNNKSASDHGSGGELSRSNSQDPVRESRDRKLQDRTKKKAPWYSALYPTYKSRSDDFKRLFKEVPADERLVVDYSCAIQKDILVHGRLYVSQNYLSFYANILRWETQVCLRWKDVTSLTKEKTARVIPNAILVHTHNDKHFLTSFTARDKTYLMLFRVWQNALMDQQMSTQEMWQWVHLCYGDELGLTSDDDDYVAPTAPEDKRPLMIKADQNLLDSYLEEGFTVMNMEKDQVSLPSNSSSPNLEHLQQLESTPSMTQPFDDSNPPDSKQQTDDASLPLSSNTKELLLPKNGSSPKSRKKTFFRSVSLQPKLACTVSPLLPDESRGRSKPVTPTSLNEALFLKDGPTLTAEEKKSSLETGDLSLPPPNQPPTPGSPSDHLPTDLSDSSPSESESEKHGSAITCPVIHEGKLMLHMQISIHVDQLFAHLFTNSKFFFDLHENIKSTDIRQSGWVTNPSTNQKGRTVNLTVQLGQAIGPKHAQVTESQKMLPCSKPGERYVIEIEASNAGIPYADAFFIVSHYCLTRGADPGTSNIAVYCQIKYRKSVWMLAKSYIEKNCWSGMEEYYNNLVKALEAECERTRRAMAAGVAGTKRKVGRRRRTSALKPLPLPSPVIEDKPYIQALPIPAKSHSSSTMDSFIWIVFFTLFVLLVLNAALYYKLWGLEQSERNLSDAAGELNLDSLRHAPQTQEEWQNLLKRQEQLHSFEVERWLRILKASVHLLQQVEKSLNVLQSSIQGAIDDGMLAADGKPQHESLPSDEL
ncbi:GRAM domain-containing protein 1B-like isoform X2 [Cimex lectularius]|uniref:VASt domain-containing protein n=1 Tax=Cimex lectularius TaxID=79782 RepID=A0A8I6RF78_CIMLE|nr:GRAM domain-containing protein 1B-like isoform X2 [Cimex lectularius]